MEDTDGICEQLEAHGFCETCGVPTCSCGATCHRMAIEATSETYPGWRPIRGLSVCVECAPQWLPEQEDLAAASLAKGAA